LSPIDAFWHLLNFFAPALCVSLVAALLAKLFWRQELRSVGWLRLSLWAMLGCAVTLIAGLTVFGHDGKIATYAAMAAVCALMLWWVGFRPWRR
jgi:glucose-6-phosphate-specific signal transduction histidine kinase